METWTVTEVATGEALNDEGVPTFGDTEPALFQTWDEAVAFAGSLELDPREFVVTEVGI